MGLLVSRIFGMLKFVILGFVIGGIRLVLRYKRYGNIDKKHEIFMLLFIAYTAGLASQTILPRYDFGILSDTGKIYLSVYFRDEKLWNLVPFRTIIDQFTGNINANPDEIMQVAVLNLSANLLLYCPLGFFLPVLWEKYKTFKKTLLAGLCVSAAVEVIQFFIGRSADIDDVFLNVIGVAIGYLLYRLLKVVMDS